MKRLCAVLLLFHLLAVSSSTFASAGDTDLLKKVKPPIDRFYVGNAFDGAIFSTATIQTTSGTGAPTMTSNTTGIVRFTLVINAGVTFNVNLARFLGVYTGIDLKNIGYITHNNAGETVKRRTYNLGLPVGIKVGNMARKGSFVLLGCGIDMPTYYKEKTFADRNAKNKITGLFTDRVPQFMPYAFAGYVFKNQASLKVQYYPNNFLNPDFTSNGYMPYSGMDVHLLLVSLGYVVRYGKHHDLVQKQVSGLKTM